MLGKLKDGLGEKLLREAETWLHGHLGQLLSLSPAVVKDNDSYRERFVGPAVVAMAAATGGASALIPRFNQRAERLLFRLRDELVVEREGKLALAEDYRERLPGVIRSGLLEKE